MSPRDVPSADRAGSSLKRLRGLVRKEFIQVWRDPSSIAVAFLMPAILLLLFGYGVSLDARHVPVAIVADLPSADTASFTSSFAGSPYFEPVVLPTLVQAEEALRRGDVRAIVRLREDFAADVRRPQGARIQLIVNGVDANTARLVQGYVDGVRATWLAQQGGQAAVELEHRIWFNSEVRSRNFLVPGLIAVIMTLIGALLTAMVLSREWERGTMEALLVTPVRMSELLLGKLITYFTLGVGGMALSVSMSYYLFEVPLRGSLWVLLSCGSLFLLTALGMGLLISSLTRVQFVAGQIAIITTFLPAFLLSGFIFDIHSMPRIVQAVTWLIAARYFVAIIQTVFLAGDVWSEILPNAAALAVMATVFLTLAHRRSRKRLE